MLQFLRRHAARQPTSATLSSRMRQTLPKRFQSTTKPDPVPPTSPAGQGASIPAPGSWLMTTVQPLARPFRAYDRVQQSRPYTTQLVSSTVIYFLGDLSAQLVNPPPATAANSASGMETTPSTYDPLRSLRAIAVGVIFSIPSYRWFLWVSSHFNYAGAPLRSLAAKVAVQQLAFAPVFNSYFFGMQSLLAGDGFEGAARRIVHAVPQSWVASCKFWPVVTAFVFAFVKPRHRSVFAGLVAIGWQTYLGLLNQRAAKELAAAEARREAVMAS